jgi:hypothetical protein
MRSPDASIPDNQEFTEVFSYIRFKSDKVSHSLPSLLGCADFHHRLNDQHHHLTLHFHPLYLELPFCSLPAYWVQPKQG